MLQGYHVIVGHAKKADTLIGKRKAEFGKAADAQYTTGHIQSFLQNEKLAVKNCKMLCYNTPVNQNILLNHSHPDYPVSDSNSLLRLNVGFIVHQTIGYSRDFNFDIAEVSIEDDLHLKGLNGAVRVTRTPQGLLVQVKMQATIQAECVRCLEIFPQPLEVDFSELFAFNKRFITESGLILPENGHINLAPLLREYMLIEVPISPFCRPDCKGLCLECGTNLNLAVCEHTASIDKNPFDALESLL